MLGTGIGVTNIRRNGGVPSWVPEGASFAADFLNQRYYRTAEPPCVRASPAYAPNLAGVYQSFSNNQLRLTDAGLYVPEPMRTNKCTNFNANPTDLTGLTKFGDAASVLSVVDDAAMIEDAGLGGICTSGLVVRLDNTAGSAEAGCIFSGVVGNTNTHSFSVWARSILGANGRIGVAGFLGGIGSISFATSYRRESISGTPVNGSQASSIRVNGGGTVYFILNQLEEASAASSPIVVDGQARFRAAETITPPIPSGTYDLHLLLDDASEHVIPGFQNGDALPLTLPQGHNIELMWGMPA